MNLRCFFKGHNFIPHSNRELTWKYLVVTSYCTTCGEVKFTEWVRGKGVKK